MKLQELIPDESKLLSLDLEELAVKVLLCLNKATEKSSVRRRGLASRLFTGYSNEYGRNSQLAIEEALMYLEHKMLIGVDPDDREFVFITRSGKELLAKQLQPFEIAAMGA